MFFLTCPSHILYNPGKFRIISIFISLYAHFSCIILTQKCIIFAWVMLVLIFESYWQHRRRPIRAISQSFHLGSSIIALKPLLNFKFANDQVTLMSTFFLIVLYHLVWCYSKSRCIVKKKKINLKVHCKKWKQNQNNAATMHLELRCRLFWVFCFNYFAHISGLNLIPSHLQDLACFFLPIPILASRSSVLSWCTCLSDGLSQLMRQHSWSAPSSFILFAKQRFCGCYADFKTYIIFFAFGPIFWTSCFPWLKLTTLFTRKWVYVFGYPSALCVRMF